MTTSPAPDAGGNSAQWVLGCCLYIVGSVTTNFAQVLFGIRCALVQALRGYLQKCSVIEPGAREGRGEDAAIVQKVVIAGVSGVQVLIRLSHMSRARGTVLWLCGLVIFACGDTLNLVALNFAAQSLLEAIGSVQFLSNLVFGVLILGEPMRKRHVVSTACIVLGNILILACGDHHNHKITLNRLYKLVQRKPFIVYILTVYPLSLVLGTPLQHSRARGSLASGARA